MKLFTNSNERNASLGVVERGSFMLGNVGTILINAVIATVLMFYYTDIMGLNAGIIGTIFLVSRIFDGVTDLIMGFIVDRTHSKHGKGRVWVLRTCIPYAISGILLVCVPGGAAGTIQYIYVFITYNLCNAVFLTAISVSYNSLMCTLTSNPYEHGLLGVFVTFGASLGAVLVQTTIDSATKALGSDARAWQLVVAGYAVIGLVFHLICFFFTKERAGETVDSQKAGEQQKIPLKKSVRALFHNHYWILANIICFMITLINGLSAGAGMYYVKSVFGDTSYYAGIANALSVTNLLALFISPLFMKRLGKRNTMLVGTVLAMLSCTLRGIASGNLLVVTAAGAVAGLGLGLLASGVYGMVADTIDYGEWKEGIKTAGIGFSGVTFGTKVATGFASVFMGWVINLSGYNGNLAVQPNKAVISMNISMNYMPAFCCLIIMICLIAYKLDNLYPQIQKELDERK